MKTLKQIREEYDDNYLSLVEQSPEELMLEGSDKKSLMPIIPSAKRMPMMLVFRRLQYKIYPNKQVVALYYSSMVDKYLSIPFGPGGNLNLSEAKVLDELDEDWQDVNRKDKTSGLSQKAVNAYRREHPGSKLQTAVTEKNPTGKRAARRKSFCARMGGMKQRLTSAKTARDPDSNINKALRRWNCEESFKDRLDELRIQQNEDWKDTADTVADVVVPYYSAGKKALKGDWKGAAKDAAVDTALMAVGGPVAKGIGKLGVKALARGTEKLGVRSAAKAGEKAIARDASAIGKSAKTPKVTPKAPKSKLGLGKKAAGAGAIGAAGGGASAVKDAIGGAVSSLTDIPYKKLGGMERTATAKTGTSWSKADKEDPITASKLKQAALKENKMSDIRTMINSENELHEMVINGKTVELNNTMAKRILEVYDSVNTKNKKIVEGMLNEDLESFKKLLTFSIRN